MKNNTLITALLIIILTGLGFFAGTKYQQSKMSNFGNRAGNLQFIGRNAGGGVSRAGGQVIGEIISSDADSITVKLTDGSSKIILIGNNTTVSKATTGNKSDLVTGLRVAVFGQTNSDGSITALNIQLNPMVRNATPSATLTR